MNISDKVRVAADYDTWRQERVLAGTTDYSVTDYERHLRAELAEERLGQISEVAADLLAAPAANREDLTSALARIARLSDLSEENQ